MRRAGPQADKYAGGHRSRVTPVPIPNTEVKPATADGTVWETVWESRSLPAVRQTKNARRQVGRFCLYGNDPNRVPRLIRLACQPHAGRLPDPDKLLLGSGNQ